MECIGNVPFSSACVLSSCCSSNVEMSSASCSSWTLTSGSRLLPFGSGAFSLFWASCVPSVGLLALAEAAVLPAGSAEDAGLPAILGAIERAESPATP